MRLVPNISCQCITKPFDSAWNRFVSRSNGSPARWPMHQNELRCARSAKCLCFRLRLPACRERGRVQSLPPPDQADVAQLVEQRFRKPQVTGSNPVVGSNGAMEIAIIIPTLQEAENVQPLISQIEQTGLSFAEI